MESINPDQKLAICHVNGPMLVLAGPGSGKTFVITRRIKHLIEEEHIPADQILVITFTKNSAEEMRERFIALMNGAACPVSFGTFHAIYFYMLRIAYGYDASNIIKEKEKRMYLRMVIESIGDDELQEDYIERILSDISRVKNDGANPGSSGVNYISESLFERVYSEYARILSDNRKLDFDDMVLQCRDMLVSRPDELNRWRETFKYILIDEFQDINPMQYEVIKLISAPHNNLFIVGDDDQSIYGFRGSKPEIMLAFPGEFPGCKMVNLSVNYRSRQEIVEKATCLINRNSDRFKKKLQAHKKERANVRLGEFKTLQEEGEFILRIINTSRRQGSLSDVAIIFRTNGAARYITKVLTDCKIPYYFREKPMSFFDSDIAKDILAILAFINGDHRRNVFLRFMNKPVRYIPRSIVDNDIVSLRSLMLKPGLKPYLIKNIEKLGGDLEYISKLDIYSAINYIRKGMGYEEWLMSDGNERGKDIQELKNVLDLIQESAKDKDGYDELLKYMDEYNEGLQKSYADEDEDRINIVTMHGSKGLEYKTVIIPGLSEGYVPQSKAMTEKSIEEERRVFYVAMTRAKENLYLTYVKKSSTNRHEMSRFLGEIKGLVEI